MKKKFSLLLILSLLLTYIAPISFAESLELTGVSVSKEFVVKVDGATPYPNSSLKLVFRNNDDEIIQLMQVKSGDNRSFSASFTLSDPGKETKFTVKADDSLSEVTKSFTYTPANSGGDSGDNNGGDSGSNGGSSKDKYIYLSVKGPDGYILSTKQYLATGDDTVEDVAKSIFDKYEIDRTNRQGYYAMIGGVSEFDHGLNSGWKYTINGVNGDGVNIQSASAGDRIKFYYVIDYEKDNRGGGNSAVIGGGSSGGSSVSSETHHKEVLKTLDKDGGAKISNSNANLFKKAVTDSLDEMLTKVAASGSAPSINDVDFMAKTATALMAYEGTVYSATVSARQFIEQFDELAEVTTDETLKASLEKQKNEIAKSLVERATTVFVSTKGSELKPGYLELDVEDALDEIIESYDKNVEKVEKKPLLRLV